MIEVHPNTHDFTDFPNLSVRELLDLLAHTVTQLANAYENLAFIKMETERNKLDKTSKYEQEGICSALEEKKWLIIHIINAKNMRH